MTSFIELATQLYDSVLKQHVRHTPVYRSSHLSDKYQQEIFVKLECLQETGSFKLRGALSKATRAIIENPNVQEFVTASGGNHGLGVAMVR